jgi:hypothetical protein
LPVRGIFDFGNDTIDHYPPACEKVEKILCLSEKIFKKIVKNFKTFFGGVKGRPNQRSLNLGASTAQIKGQKSLSKLNKPRMTSNDLALPYRPYEPSNLAESMGLCRHHRIGRVQDWHSTYGQGMYE